MVINETNEMMELPNTELWIIPVDFSETERYYVISRGPNWQKHLNFHNKQMAKKLKEIKKSFGGDFMKTFPYLLIGNHPKSGPLKRRIIQIIKILKENRGKIEANELEKKLGVSRTEEPSKFYKPLAALKEWRLVHSHRTVVFDEKGKKHFKTTYELTPEFFFAYIRDTIIGKCKTELEMI